MNWAGVYSTDVLNMNDLECDSPTSGEAWGVVVDVRKCDGDCCGSWEATHLATHIFGLDDQQILVSRLSVHIG